MDEERKETIIDMHGGRISESAIRQALQRSMIAGAISMSWFAVAFGMPIQMFFEALGATGVVIGLVGTIQQVAMLAQVPGAFITEKVASRKKLVVWFLLLQRGIWFVPALIALFFPQDTIAHISLLVVIGISSFAGQSVTATWFSWMADLIPKPIAGRYWGRRQTMTTLALIASLIGIGWYLDMMSSRGGQYTMYGFATVFLFATVSGVLDPLLNIRVIEPARERIRKSQHFFSHCASLFTSRDFLFSSMAFGAWAFAINLLNMFANIYLRREFHITYFYIALLAIAASAGAACASVLWGHIIDRIGPRTTAGFVFLIAPYMALAWFFVAPRDVTIALPFLAEAVVVPQAVLILTCTFFLAGMIYSGVLLSQVNLITVITGTKGRTASLAVHWSIVGFIGMLGPLAGGYIMDYFVKNPLNITLFTGAELSYMHMLALVHIFLSWGIALPLLLLVRRKNNEMPFAHAAGKFIVTNPLRAIRSMYGIVSVSAPHSRSRHIRVMQGLGKLRASVAVHDVIERLADPSVDVRDAAVEALGEMGTREAVDALLRELEDPTSDVRLHVIRALHNQPSAWCYDAVVPHLNDTDKAICRETARTLGAYGDARAVEPLVAVLRSTDDDSLRLTICDALGKLGDPTAIYAIVPFLLVAPTQKMRRAFVASIGEILITDEDFYRIYARERNEKGTHAAVQLRRLRQCIRAHVAKKHGERKTYLLRTCRQIAQAYEAEDYRQCVELLHVLGQTLAAGEDMTSADDDITNDTQSVAEMNPRYAAGMWYLQQIGSRHDSAPYPSEVFLGMCFVRSWYETFTSRAGKTNKTATV